MIAFACILLSGALLRWRLAVSDTMLRHPAKHQSVATALMAGMTLTAILQPSTPTIMTATFTAGAWMMPFLLGLLRAIRRPSYDPLMETGDDPTVWSETMREDEVSFKPFRKLVGPLRGSVPRYYGRGWSKLARFGDLVHSYDIRERWDDGLRTVIIIWKNGGIGVVVRYAGAAPWHEGPARLMDSTDSPRMNEYRMPASSLTENDIPDVADAVMTRYAAAVIHSESRTVERSMIPYLTWFRYAYRCAPLYRILSHAEYDPTFVALGWLDEARNACGEYDRIRNEYRPRRLLSAAFNEMKDILRQLRAN